jgi:hypothetical protein
MATRQITVQPDELPMMLLAALTTAHTFAQHGHLEEVGRSLVRAGELLLALKEAVAALPKSNSSAEGKRA